MTTTTYRAIRDGHLISAQESNGQGRIRARVAGYDVDYTPTNARMPHRLTVATRVRRTERVPVQWAHGGWSETPATPIGDAAVSTASDGIVIDAAMDTDTDSGLSVYRRYASGALREWSIGYVVRAYHVADGVWVLDEIELVEVSAVIRGANPDTRTLDVAAASAGTPRVDVDAIARKHRMPDPDEMSPALRAALDRARGPGLCTSMATVAAQLRDHAAEGLALTMSPELTRAWLAATGSPLTGHEPYLVDPSYAPVAPGILDLVTVIPHNAGTVKAPVVTFDVPPGEPIIYGDLAHDVAMTATGAAKKMARFPVSTEEDADVLTDAGRGEEAVLATLQRTTRGHINAALLVATGAIDDFEGVLGVAGQQLNATGLSGVQVLSRAARLVHDAGFSGALACIGHPSTVDQVFLGRSVREEVPAISTYVASPQVPFDSCLIADWRAACTLYLGSTLITSTRADGVNFRLSRTLFLAETRAHASWQQLDAVVEVTNVATS